MDKPPVDIRANIENVRERITKAAERAGRDPSEILLVGQPSRCRSKE
jgi:uncharacterized pyridoxal phosphate-containing UPF0001 family protein